jgi:hypothetical protein
MAFREAVAIDTAFGMAYRKLGVALGNAGMPQESRDSALKAAYRHRARILAIDSTNFAAANNLAILTIERREFARAEALLRRVLESGTVRATLIVNLIDAQVRQGRFAAADSTAALARRALPQNASTRTLDLYILAGRRSFDSLESRLKSIAANDADDVNRYMAQSSLRDVAYARGRIAEALRIGRELYAIDEARGAPRKP